MYIRKLKNVICDCRGSAALEASLAMPFFIFAVIAFYQMLKIKQTEQFVYEACVETIEYLAENAYINESGIIIPSTVFSGYVDDSELMESYIKGGKNGVSFFGSYDDGTDIVLIASYEVHLSIPFINELTGKRVVRLRQRSYRGHKSDSEDEDEASDERYVYVTDNLEAYHEKRSCSYLRLSIYQSNLTVAKNSGYTPCEYCGKRAFDNELCYITTDGGRYHSTIKCSRLVRRVRVVALSDIEGVSPCTRCAR